MPSPCGGQRASAGAVIVGTVPSGLMLVLSTSDLGQLRLQSALMARSTDTAGIRTRVAGPLNRARAIEEVTAVHDAGVTP